RGPGPAPQLADAGPPRELDLRHPGAGLPPHAPVRRSAAARPRSARTPERAGATAGAARELPPTPLDLIAPAHVPVACRASRCTRGTVSRMVCCGAACPVPPP